MTSLVVGEISAVLFGLPQPGTLHWTICLPVSHTSAFKLHATQEYDGGALFFEDPPSHFSPLGLLPRTSRSVSILSSYKSPAVIHSAILGELKTRSDYDTIYHLLQAIPMSIPAAEVHIEPLFTCRVWFKEAIRVLHSNGLINCPDVNALVEECKSFARTNQPIYRTTYCGYRHFVAQSSK